MIIGGSGAPNSLTEYNIPIILDSRQATSGNWTDFVVQPAIQRLPKIRSLGMYLTSGCYTLNTMNPLNRRLVIGISNDSNQFTINMTTGTYSRTGPPPTGRIAYDAELQTQLNTNPFGAVFTVTYVPNNGEYVISSTLPFRLITVPKEHRYTFGTFATTSYATSVTTSFGCFIYSEIIYVSSQAITRYSNLGLTTANVPNCIGLVFLSEVAFAASGNNGINYDTNQLNNIISFQYEPTASFGPIDLTLYDSYGNKLNGALESPQDDSGFFTVTLKAVTDAY